VAQATADPSGNVPSVPVITPTPTPHSTIVITPPPDRTAEVIGKIAFSKLGDLYVATGRGDIQPVKGTRTSGNDARFNSGPVWSPDGRRLYFIQTREKQVQAPYNGKLVKYTFFYPVLMSVAAEGGDAKVVYDSIFPLSGGQWHRWVLQPDVSPDGDTFALVTDGTDGFGDVLLGTMTTRGSQLRQLDGVPAVDGQGHNDPEWSPDGRRIAFTYNNRSGNVGTPRIGIFNVRSGKMENLLKAGYANPSWSPDGKVIAAERTDGTGRDIVILNPQNGTEIARMTNDGDSFAPTFSPNGDQIAFLRRKGLDVDLWILTMDPANGYTRLSLKPVTEDGSLDAESPPTWFIPQDQRRQPATPEPQGSDPSAEAASPSPAP
jgi:TolB protein